MFENILRAKMKICKYSRNNQKSYDGALNQLGKISIESKLLVYFIFAVQSFTM